MVPGGLNFEVLKLVDAAKVAAAFGLPERKRLEAIGLLARTLRHSRDCPDTKEI